jgi:hypothetical protein
MTVQAISPVMSTASEQIKQAWALLENGALMDDLRGSWTRLTTIRRELDGVVVALAYGLERLRAETKAPPYVHQRRDHEGERGERGAR